LVTQGESSELRLTQRQREILLLLEQGEHIADVADILNIEVMTAPSHLRDIATTRSIFRAAVVSSHLMSRILLP